MYASKMTFLLVFNIIIHQIGHRKNKSIPMTDILMQEKKKPSLSLCFYYMQSLLFKCIARVQVVGDN